MMTVCDFCISAVYIEYCTIYIGKYYVSRKKTKILHLLARLFRLLLCRLLIGMMMIIDHHHHGESVDHHDHGVSVDDQKVVKYFVPALPTAGFLLLMLALSALRSARSNAHLHNFFLPKMHFDN